MAVEGKHKNLLKGERLRADLSVLKRRRDGTTATMETSSAANNFTLQWTTQCSTARPLGTRPMIFCMMARELPATPKPAAPSHGKLKTERKGTRWGSDQKAVQKGCSINVAVALLLQPRNRQDVVFHRENYSSTPQPPAQLNWLRTLTARMALQALMKDALHTVY